MIQNLATQDQVSKITGDISSLNDTITKLQLVKVSGVTATFPNTVTLNYPSGFNKNNCILSGYVLHHNAGNFILSTGINVMLSDTNITVQTQLNDQPYFGIGFDLYLQKIG